MDSLAFVLLLVLGMVAASNGTHRHELISVLFNNYEPSMRPAPNGGRIDLNVKITLHHFEFSSNDGSFHFVGNLDVGWTDPKLKWKPSDYGNLTHLAISQRLIWVPDLEVYNNAPDKMFRMHRNGAVLLSHDGSMFWSDTISVNTFCASDMQYYPRDSHNCKITLGSWTYDALEVNITNNMNTSMNFDKIDRPNMAYDITNFTAVHVFTEYPCCSEPYVTIDYYINFVRRSNYAVIFKLSAFCAILLGLLSVSETLVLHRKISLAALAFLIIIIHLLYFSTHIGRLSRDTPAIVMFYAYNLLILTLTTIMSLLSVALGVNHVRTSISFGVYRFIQNSCLVVAFEYCVQKEFTSGCDESNLVESETNLRSLISPTKRICVFLRAQRICLLIAIISYTLVSVYYCV